MQKCSICEKPIYNQPTPKQGALVCGSCPLNSAPGGATGKSQSEVRMDMTKLVTKSIPPTEETVMTSLRVRSNVRNNTILLDGRFPIVFGSDGYGVCPAHLRDLFEREMTMKPGRFSIVVGAPAATEPLAVAFVVEPVEVPAPVAEPVVEVPAPEVAPVADIAPVEEVPATVDQSFLATEADPEKPVKASKKK